MTGDVKSCKAETHGHTSTQASGRLRCVVGRIRVRRSSCGQRSRGEGIDRGRMGRMRRVPLKSRPAVPLKVRLPELPRLPLRSRVIPETERLVRRRAGYRCEACGSPVGGQAGEPGACLRVVRLNRRRLPEDVMAGPANAVFLCGTCADGARRRNPLLKARGFWSDDADPRFEPMAIACGDSIATVTAVWRSEDGHYLYDPPGGALRPPTVPGTDPAGPVNCESFYAVPTWAKGAARG
jgi:hypothetical protein